MANPSKRLYPSFAKVLLSSYCSTYPRYSLCAPTISFSLAHIFLANLCTGPGQCRCTFPSFWYVPLDPPSNPPLNPPLNPPQPFYVLHLGYLGPYLARS